MMADDEIQDADAVVNEDGLPEADDAEAEEEAEEESAGAGFDAFGGIEE